MISAIVIGGAWLAFLTFVCLRCFPQFPKLTQLSCLGKRIPTAFGIVIALWSLPALFTWGSAPQRPEVNGMVAAVSGFALLGLLDDLRGDREHRGLRGHLRALFQDGRLTTGLIKLVGGAALGVAIPALVLGHPWPLSILEGALISLCANAFNLLDLRPGRAGAVFLIIAGALTWVGWSANGAPPPLIFVLIPALVVDVFDARGTVMLGDTGSNLIGGALGLSLVHQLESVGAKAGIVVVLAALHLIAERWSLSKIIEGNNLLRTLDRCTGVRPEKETAPD